MLASLKLELSVLICEMGIIVFTGLSYVLAMIYVKRLALCVAAV